MNIIDTPKYDVVVVEDLSGKVVAVIGKNLNAKDMERRIETGIMRVDMSRFHVKEVEAGQGEILLAKVSS